MAPKSAKRKAPAKATKRTPKSKQQQLVESISVVDVADDNKKNNELKSQESTQSEGIRIGVTQLESESVASQPAIGEEAEIKQEIQHENEKFTTDTTVKAELVGEEEKDNDNVMDDHNTEDRLEMEIESHTDVQEDHDKEEVVEMEVENDKDCDENIILEEKVENVAGERERDGGNDGLQSVTVAELHSVDQETVACQTNIGEELVNSDNLLVVHEGSSNRKVESANSEDGGGDDEDNEANKDVEDTDDVPSDRRRRKNLEIFVRNLDNEVAEDDLIQVFGSFGEIKYARIIRRSTRKKIRAFAFIQYATNEQAKAALSSLKDGVEVKGKHVEVSASQGKDTLYVGNICKTWTENLVLEMLKHYGVNNMEEIHLPDDPRHVGRTKGYALLEFSTHCDAKLAFERLKKPDAVFGRDISAKVGFAEPPELPSQVKRVYMEGLTDGWNEEKVREICKQYGQIIEVQLFQKLGSKSKDFGFITFHSRESALACVEGINNARIVEEGQAKVKASIARPQNVQRQKDSFVGGFKVNEVSTSGKEAGKSKPTKRKGKEEAFSESRIIDGGCKLGKSRIQPKSKLESANHERKTLSTKVKDLERGSKRPLKKPRVNTQGRPASTNNRNPKRDPHVRKRPPRGLDYRHPYAPKADTSTAYYQGDVRNSISASNRWNTDMEPHAGFIQPTAVKQVQPNLAHFDHSATGLRVQPQAVYLEPATGTRGQPYIEYVEPAAGLEGRRARYVEPTTVHHIQGQTRAVYIEPVVRTYGFQPAVGNHGHDLYDPQLRRAGAADGQSRRNYTYGGGSSLTLPLSYAPSYSSYAIHEGSSAGGYYQSAAAYPPGRSYHQTKY